MSTTEHFDVVVVGSGFGGSVMAYRLADAGLSVCVLERGKRYPPNSFPRTPREMWHNFWDPSEGYYGLFDIWSFRGKLTSLKGLEAVVCSGLGGGSLIYANVLLRKPEKWFVKEDLHNGGYEYWPVTREDLDPHYERVEQMLGAQQYPFMTHAPYNTTPKTRQMRHAAEQLGLEWQLPNLAVTFANQDRDPALGEPIVEPLDEQTGKPMNLHGLPRYTCRLCGECDLGCNYGSKNTLDFNYLTEAWRRGAEIRTLCEVRGFAPHPKGGYVIRYVEHNPEERGGKRTNTRKLEHVDITAKQLVLSAGTLGSTYLLLRNRRRHFPAISDQLGRRFSGNGDLLTFAFNAREQRDGKEGPRVLAPSYGPVITSAVHVPDELDGSSGRGFYIEDAGYPVFLDWALEVTHPTLIGRGLRFAARRVWSVLTGDPASNLSGEFAAALGSGILSSTALPMLGMGRDIPDGVMSLRKGYLDVDWTIDTSREYFDRLRDTARAIADVWQADFRDNPIWGLSRVVTVHALGGCPMGRDEHEGVVNSYGEVFNYPGLYIADGSVMPGPVGPNPSLTIAALADRFATRMVG
jgi:cholesterol oxidase